MAKANAYINKITKIGERPQAPAAMAGAAAAEAEIFIRLLSKPFPRLRLDTEHPIERTEVSGI